MLYMTNNYNDSVAEKYKTSTIGEEIKQASVLITENSFSPEH